MKLLLTIVLSHVSRLLIVTEHIFDLWFLANARVKRDGGVTENFVLRRHVQEA